MKKKKNNEPSPIFSILDAFRYTPDTLFTFVDLGVAPMCTHHVCVFFRFSNGSDLHISKDSYVSINRYVSLYQIFNETGDLTGFLFSLKDSKDFTLSDKTLCYRSSTPGGFTLFPYISDKVMVFIYKDTKDNVLINIGNPLGNRYVVQDV